MVGFKVIIQSLEDYKNGVAIYKPTGDLTELSIDTVGILESGTVGRKESLMVFLVAPDGREYFAQMTGALLHMLHGALAGAEQRFADEQAKKQ